MHEVRMPQIALGDEEMTIVAWHRSPGQIVEAGEVLLEVETEKATMDVESPFGGTLVTQLCSEGDLVSAGQVIAVLAAAREDHDGVDSRGVEAPKIRPERVPPSAVTTPGALAPRRAAAPENLVTHGELRGIPPGSAIGHITLADVDVPPEAQAEQLSRRRLATARRLTEAALIPQFSVTREIPIGGAAAAVAAARANGIGATLTDAFLVAVGKAATAVPRANAWLVGETLRRFERVAVALAVDTVEGVLAPVVMNADQLKLSSAARVRADVVERARSGKLAAPELTGATITLSNIGGIGGDSVVPVLTPPQVAAVGVGRGRNAELAPAATFTFVGDHRCLDGADGARFLVALELELQALAPQ